MSSKFSIASAPRPAAHDLSASQRLRAALGLEEVTAMREELWLALRSGADPNEKFSGDVYSGTPLGLAINLQRVEGVQILLAHGANPNARCSHRYWPLQRAAMLGNPALCEDLIAAGADLGPQGRDGKTALMDIGSARLRPPSDADCARTARVLLQAGCDPLVQGVDGAQALHEAIGSSRMGVVREILLHLVDAGGPLEVSGPHPGAAKLACFKVNQAERERLRCTLRAAGMPAEELELSGLPSLVGWSQLEAAAAADWTERVDQLLVHAREARLINADETQRAARRAIEHGHSHMAAYLQSRSAMSVISKLARDRRLATPSSLN